MLKGFDDAAGAENAVQEDWLLGASGRIDGIERDRLGPVAQLDQQRIDLRRVLRLVGLQGDDLVVGDELAGDICIQGDRLVELAGDSPVGSEVDQHRLVVLEVLCENLVRVGPPEPVGGVVEPTEGDQAQQAAEGGRLPIDMATASDK